MPRNYALLGINLRKIRIEQKITRRELSEMACISYNTIVNAEHGHRTPSLYVALQIADALQVEINELTGDTK